MIRAELCWAVRGRTFVVLLLVAVALNVLSAYGAASGLPEQPAVADALMQKTTVTIAALGFGGGLFAMLFGAMNVTNDFRSAAIVRRSFLAGGSGRLMRTRLIALAIPALAFALLSAGAVVVTSLVALPLRGYRFETSHDFWVVLMGVLFSVFAMTYFGQAVGWLVRNTTIALVGLLAWSLVAETLIIGLLPTWGVYLPGGATQSITLDRSVTDLILPVGAGYAVLAGWVVALATAAAVRLRVTDLV